MITEEWIKLMQALESSVNSDGGLHYNIDATLDRKIGKYASKNLDHFGHPKDLNYSCSPAEVRMAIYNWVNTQEKLENKVLGIHTQLEAGQFDEEAIKKITPQLVKEGKLLVRGVAVDSIFKHPDRHAPWLKQMEDFFNNVGIRAIEIFQQEPTALILFPKLDIDSRLIADFYTQSTAFNIWTLKAKFQNVNGHFKIDLCTVSEEFQEFSSDERYERNVGMLFTYVDPW